MKSRFPGPPGSSRAGSTLSHPLLLLDSNVLFSPFPNQVTFGLRAGSEKKLVSVGMMPEQERQITAREEASRKVSFFLRLRGHTSTWRAFLLHCRRPLGAREDQALSRAQRQRGHGLGGKHSAEKAFCPQVFGNIANLARFC